jgi:hypothetical protein
MAPCYVVFEGKKPSIYFTWYECAKQVLKEEGAIYQKYGSYDEALRAFSERVPAALLLLLTDGSSGLSSAAPLLLPTDSLTVRKHGYWKNVIILILLMVVVALCYLLFMCKK